MEMILRFFDILLHLDKYINIVIQDYGSWTYLIFFIIACCETGLIVRPMLPGNSLLFIAGSYAATGSLKIAWLSGHGFVVSWSNNLVSSPLKIEWLLFLFSAAAILGGIINYWIGNFVGQKVSKMRNGHIFKKETLNGIHQFYEKYGPITLVIGRFVPIIRPLALFLSGVGSMTYPRFLTYNVAGGILWVFSFTLV
jgi:membrane-associated protein